MPWQSQRQSWPRPPIPWLQHGNTRESDNTVGATWNTPSQLQVCGEDMSKVSMSRSAISRAVCVCFHVQGKCHWHFYFYNKAVGQEVVTCTYIVPHVKTEVSKHSHKRKIDTQSRRQLVIKRFKYQLGTHHQRETKLRRSHSDDILTEVRGIHLIS